MWRDTARNVQIRGIGDARIIFPLAFLLFFPSWNALLVCMVCIAVLVLINYKGFTFLVFLRWLRAKLIGNIRLARSSIYQRRFYGKASASSARHRNR